MEEAAIAPEVVPEAKPEESDLRLREWILVVATAFGPVLYSQVHAWANGAHLLPLNSHDLVFGFGVVILQQLASLAVLCYVLFRQGRSLVDLGRPFAWTDLLEGIGLLLLVIIVGVVIASATTSVSVLGPSAIKLPRLAMYIAATMINGKAGGFPAATLWFLNITVVTLIGNAFTVSEIEGSSGSRVLAFMVAFGLQAVGTARGIWVLRLILAATIAIFTVYYLMRRRVVPIIFCCLLYCVLGISLP